MIDTKVQAERKAMLQAPNGHASASAINGARRKLRTAVSGG